MAISDLYSHRKNKKAQSGQSDVYQYDSIPGYVINQIIMILDDSIGKAREYGDPSVNIWPSGHQSCVNFPIKHVNIDSELDIIEFAFKVIDEKIRNYEGVGYYGIIMTPDEAIAELNYRLREGGVGYQYENGVMIRMDNQFVHAEITKKALSLLSSQQFSGAEDINIIVKATRRGFPRYETTKEAMDKEAYRNEPRLMLPPTPSILRRPT
jgi:hypothetical protein